MDDLEPEDEDEDYQPSGGSSDTDVDMYQEEQSSKEKVKPKPKVGLKKKKTSKKKIPSQLMTALQSKLVLMKLQQSRIKIRKTHKVCNLVTNLRLHI